MKRILTAVLMVPNIVYNRYFECKYDERPDSNLN